MTTWWVSKEDLVDEQLAVIDLPVDASHLILGPPGSGKTNLLLLRANFLFLGSQPNLEIIVFTRSLRDFLAAGADIYDFPMEKLRTFRGWQLDLLRRYGVGHDEPLEESFSEGRERLNGLIRDEIIGRLGLADVYDALLVDESHDDSPEEIANFRVLCRNLYAVADSRQKIYSTPDCMDVLKDSVDTVVTLKKHFRVAPMICRVADEIGRRMGNYELIEPNSNYDSAKYPPSVEVIRAKTVEEQLQRVLQRLDLQVKAYPDDLVGILCPTNSVAEKAWAAFSESPFSDVSIRQGGGEHGSFGPEARICISTIHSAKGLEFRSVHLLAADQLHRTLQLNLAYTAVTRSKTALTVYHAGSLPGFLDAAIRRAPAEAAAVDWRAVRSQV